LQVALLEYTKGILPLNPTPRVNGRGARWIQDWTSIKVHDGSSLPYLNGSKNLSFAALHLLMATHRVETSK
jgi:hypothetical protein